MTNSISDIVNDAEAYFVIGSNTTEQHPVIGIQLRQAVKRGAKLIMADPREVDMASMATLYLQQKPGSDVALLNGLMNVIIAEELWDKEFVETRTEEFDELVDAVAKYTPEVAAEITGVPAEDIRQAARLLAAAKPASLLYAMGITQHTCGHQNVLSCANLQMLLGNMGVPGGGVNPLRGQNNVQGACDMGGLPNVYPGYQRVTDEAARRKFEAAWGAPLSGRVGLTVTEMMNAAHSGQIKALYVFGENPMVSDPDTNHVRECLENLDFLIVQDMFLTETAERADVVLPAASFAEKEGTVTNTERRVQRLRVAIPPVGDSKPDWQILSELAKRILDETGQEIAPDAAYGGWDYAHPSNIMDEIAALTPIYGGIAYSRLAGKGLQWPCSDADHPGTSILHVGRFSRGLGHFSGVEWTPPNEVPDEEYPFLLTTGRVLQHFHTGTMTHRVEGLEALVPEERVRINVIDADRLKLADGDWAIISSRRGQVKARVAVGEESPPGLVFMTFHFAKTTANLLTNPALDPVAKIPEYKVCAVRLEAA